MCRIHSKIKKPDPAIHKQTDLQMLFALSIVVWAKMAIDGHIMKHHDPATMLVTLILATNVAGHMCIACIYYLSPNVIQWNTDFSNDIFYIGLLAYWALYCIQHNNREDVLYD
ncbi:hypothetical protein FIBSPDRAFT_902756 [Athelia psychrophila]|uniref:Uncharacterized protein n=1 Tax=Athelia psychrophila TaxID=1759441 RepID=A0A167WV84_9AGAM|nr:hypothetical protein FIBSPDRAFT_902756 [Fibularhizoctonia sp. CBS 109695]